RTPRRARRTARRPGAAAGVYLGLVSTGGQHLARGPADAFDAVDYRERQLRHRPNAGAVGHDRIAVAARLRQRRNGDAYTRARKQALLDGHLDATRRASRVAHRGEARLEGDPRVIERMG